MSEEKSASSEKAVAAETEIEPASGEMTEDELSEAVGGTGTVDEQVPQTNSDSAGSGWWNDPNL